MEHITAQHQGMIMQPQYLQDASKTSRTLGLAD